MTRKSLYSFICLFIRFYFESPHSLSIHSWSPILFLWKKAKKDAGTCFKVRALASYPFSPQNIGHVHFAGKRLWSVQGGRRSVLCLRNAPPSLRHTFSPLLVPLLHLLLPSYNGKGISPLKPPVPQPQVGFVARGKEGSRGSISPAAASPLSSAVQSFLQQMQPWLQVAEPWQEASVEINILCCWAPLLPLEMDKLGHDMKARTDNCKDQNPPTRRDFGN